MLLAEFPEFTTHNFISFTYKAWCKHFIKTTGSPISVHARCLPLSKLCLTEWRPWAVPLRMVPKASGGWRPYRDYRHLNDATIPNRYSVPHIHDFLAHLARVRIFSKIDLIQGYHQIPVAPEDTPYFLY